MSVNPLRPMTVSDSVLSRFLQNIVTWSRDVVGVPIISGNLIEDVQITTSTTRIDHGLGKNPTGWIIVKKNADARVWETASTNRTLTLDSNATVTVSVWVF